VTRLSSSSGQGDEAQQAAPDPRQESLEERADRNLGELVQELRVVGLGVQVLFGFLLSLPFTMRFTKLTDFERDLYLASLVLAALATTLLIGPVAYHRLVFRRGMKEQLVRSRTRWPSWAWPPSAPPSWPLCCSSRNSSPARLRGR
jgi:hypothetical protein